MDLEANRHFSGLPLFSILAAEARALLREQPQRGGSHVGTDRRALLGGIVGTCPGLFYIRGVAGRRRRASRLRRRHRQSEKRLPLARDDRPTQTGYCEEG